MTCYLDLQVQLHQILVTNFKGNVQQLEGELEIRSWELKD